MKKIILLFVTALGLTTVSTFAQDVITNKTTTNQNASSSETGTMSAGHSFFRSNIGYTHPSGLPSGVKVLDLTLNFDYGYFLFDNFALTVNLGPEFSRTSIASTEETHNEGGYWTYSGQHRIWVSNSYTTGEAGSSSSSFNFKEGVGVRYYIAGKIFIGAALSSTTHNFSDYSVCLNPYLGYSYFTSQHFAYEASVGYLKGIGSADGYKAIEANLGVGFYF